MAQTRTVNSMSRPSPGPAWPSTTASGGTLPSSGARYDLVVIRSPWDYVPRLSEYRRWLEAMDQLGTLRNPAAVVEWNIDKRYLLELGGAGVPVIPTRIATSEQDLARRGRADGRADGGQAGDLGRKHRHGPIQRR